MVGTPEIDSPWLLTDPPEALLPVPPWVLELPDVLTLLAPLKLLLLVCPFELNNDPVLLWTFWPCDLELPWVDPPWVIWPWLMLPWLPVWIVWVVWVFWGLLLPWLLSWVLPWLLKLLVPPVAVCPEEEGKLLKLLLWALAVLPRFPVFMVGLIFVLAFPLIFVAELLLVPFWPFCVKELPWLFWLKIFPALVWMVFWFVVAPFVLLPPLLILIPFMYMTPLMYCTFWLLLPLFIFVLLFGCWLPGCW